MGVKLDWNGLNEFRDMLRQLPEHLTGEAVEIVESAAQSAAREVQSNYPVRQTGLHPTRRRKSSWFPPGSLKSRVFVARERNSASVRSIVRIAAPHAWLYEKGTKGVRRHDSGKSVGKMPAAPLGKSSIPVFIKYRALMRRGLVSLLERAGFKVSA